MTEETTEQLDLSRYVGRWVAFVDQQVAGVGATGPAARNMARRNRPKRPITVQYVPDLSGKPLTLSPLLAELAPALAKLNTPIYLVGGAVRDAVLGRVSHDLDFVVPEQGVHIAFRLGDHLRMPAYPLDKERDVGRVRWTEKDLFLDIAAFRGDSLEADLRDRDFTINAMAIPALAQTTAEIIDPTGGLADLESHTIAVTHPDAITKDPVRALRAIRMGIRYSSQLTAETKTAVRATLPALHQTSEERLRDELLNLLCDVPEQALQQLDQLGGLGVLLPQIEALKPIEQSPPHHEAVWAHTLSVLRWLGVVLKERVYSDDHRYAEKLRVHLARSVTGFMTGKDLLRLGALYHDVGKAQTKSVGDDSRIHFYEHDQVGGKITETRLTEFHFSRETITHVSDMVRGHMRPLLLAQEPEVSIKAQHRFFRQYGTVGIDICLLSLADHLATYNGVGSNQSWEKLTAVVNGLLHHYYQHEEQSVQQPPLINGRDVMTAFQWTGGPAVGNTLRAVREAQIAGEVTTKEEALQYAEQLLQDNASQA